MPRRDEHRIAVMTSASQRYIDSQTKGCSRTMSDTVRFTFTLPRALKEKLESYAAAESRSRSWIVQEALRIFLEQNPPPPQQSSLFSNQSTDNL